MAGRANPTRCTAQPAWLEAKQRMCGINLYLSKSICWHSARNMDTMHGRPMCTTPHPSTYACAFTKAAALLKRPARPCRTFLSLGFRHKVTHLHTPHALALLDRVASMQKLQVTRCVAAFLGKKAQHCTAHCTCTLGLSPPHHPFMHACIRPRGISEDCFVDGSFWPHARLLILAACTAACGLSGV